MGEARGVEQDRPGQAAQRDLPRELRGGAEVEVAQGVAVPRGRGRAAVHVHGGERGQGVDEQPARAARDRRLGRGERLGLRLGRVVEGAGGEANTVRAERGAQPGGLGRVVGEHGRAGGEGREAQRRVGAARDQADRAGRRRHALGRHAQPLAALRRAGDAHGNERALGRQPSAFAVPLGQERLRGRPDEGAAHRRGQPRHARAQQVAHAVGLGRPLHHVASEPPVRRAQRHAPLAGRARHEDHGFSQPTPRRSWAVSNSGRPTTLLWLPDRKRTNISARPWIA